MIVHPFFMADMIGAAEWKTPLIWAQRAETDYQPALPFIQEFENPTHKQTPYQLFQYADYVSFSDIAFDTVLEAAVSSVANEMISKMNESVAAMVAATGTTGGSNAGQKAEVEVKNEVEVTSVHDEVIVSTENSSKPQPSPARGFPSTRYQA